MHMRILFTHTHIHTHTYIHTEWYWIELPALSNNLEVNNKSNDSGYYIIVFDAFVHCTKGLLVPAIINLSPLTV